MLYPDSKRDPRNEGFTLIELLVTLVIIAILAAIAIPQYRTIVDKTRIAAAEYELNQCMRGLFFYQTENDTNSFPATNMITSYDDLANIIAIHIGRPPATTDAKFTFVSYAGADSGFTIVAKARDSNRTTLTGTHLGIAIAP